MQKIKRSRQFLAAFCAVALTVTTVLSSFSSVYAEVNGDGTPEINEAYANGESLQPLPGGYNVDTLLKWTPESDPDARYAKASIPLAEGRFEGPLVNQYANKDAKLMVCTLSNANHDNTPVQGGEVFDSYAFTHWQYVDTMVYWAGSNEGIFVIPTPDIIDSAHKNGVKVTATLGFPWGTDSTTDKIRIEEVKKFVQKRADGTFPVADKMIEVAKYYGFDGYFFNQETYGCTAEMAADMNDMIRYMEKKAPEFVFNWYDSVIETGNVSYQDAVNEKNKFWVEPRQSDGTDGIDEFFMNYNWSRPAKDAEGKPTINKIEKTIETMNSIGRSPFDAFAGYEMQANGIIKDGSTKEPYADHMLVDPKTGKLRLSLALYCPNSTQGFATDPVDFHNQENRLYVSSTGDPTNEPIDPTNPEEGNWPGLARFFADKSVITEAPFVTNFNTGHGMKWYVNGEVSRDKEWNNRSMQDIAPTWTWTIRSDSDSKLEGAYDFDTAYNGGNSVKLTGDLSGMNEALLYSTNIKNAKTAEITYKVNKEGSTVRLGLGTSSTSYADSTFNYYDLGAGSATVGEWKTATVNIADSTNISAISILVDGSATDYQLNIGKIAILDSSSSTLAAPASVTLDEIMYNNAREAQVRLYWDKVADADYYELYKVDAANNDEFINATPNNAFFIPTLEKNTGKQDLTIKVVPVGKDGKRGTAKSFTFKWALNEDASTDQAKPEFINVALNAEVTGYSGQGEAEPAAKALDGTALNGSKWCATNDSDRGWMSIDLGAPKTIKRWRVEHAEYGGEGRINNTIDFDLQYKNAKGEWVIAKEIKGNTLAITDVLLDTPVTAQEWKLNVSKGDGGQWKAVRVYEWQMFETDTFPPTENIPTNYAKAVNNDGAKDTFTLKNVSVDSIVKLYKSNTAAEPFATKKAVSDNPDASKVTVEFTDLDLGDDEGRVWYTVTYATWDESNRLSVAYEATIGDKTPNINSDDVTFTRYYAPLEMRSRQVPVTVTVDKLQAGDVVYVYENESDEYTKQSVPVATGKDSANIDRIYVSEGDEIQLQIKRDGKRSSDKVSVVASKIVDPIEKVTISPKTQNANSGDVINFTATVTTTPTVVNAIKTTDKDKVVWSLKGNDAETKIDQAGKLTISSVATSSVITVTATSALNPDKKDIAFVGVGIDATKPITSLTIAAGNESVERGKSTKFTANTNDGASKIIIWDVEGEQDVKTYVDQTGKLFIGADEGAEKLTVTAYAGNDVTIKHSVEVKVKASLNDVRAVRPSPSSTTVKYGAEKQFTANVDARFGADKSVTWEIVGDVHDNTTIDQNGLLKISADEESAKFTVKATSVYNDKVSGMATVNVRDVAAVTISSEIESLNRGESYVFKAEVDARKGVDKSVIWSIDTGKEDEVNPVSMIDKDGKLTIGLTETAETISVYAVSVVNENRWAVKEIAIGNAPEKPSSVESVTVSPKAVDVKYGKTQQFKAEVKVVNGASKDVLWSVSGAKNSETKIDANGLLTVGAKETSTKLVVKATSTVDKTKFDTAAVTVEPYKEPSKPTPPSGGGSSSGGYSGGGSSTPAPSAPVTVEKNNKTEVTVKEPETTVVGNKAEVTVPTIDTSSASASKPIEITVNVPSDKVVDLIKNNTGSQVVIDVTIPSALFNTANVSVKDINADKAIFKQAKESGKQVVLNVKDSNGNVVAEWTFDGKSVTNVLDTNLSLIVKNSNSLPSISNTFGNNANAAVVSFNHSGLLPGTASVKLDVSKNFKNGDTLSLYYNNTATGKLDKVSDGIVVDVNGKATVKISHCSDYVLVKTGTATNAPTVVAPSTNPQTGDSWWRCLFA